MMKRKPKVVTSRENGTFRELRRLARSAGERRKRGRALLDGVRLVEVFLGAGGSPRMLVVRESAADDERVREVAGLRPEAPVTVLADPLFAEVATEDVGCISPALCGLLWT